MLKVVQLLTLIRTLTNELNNIWEHCGGPWHYNQAIGWLRLYVLGSQVRGDWFFTKAKRIPRIQKEKGFRKSGKAFELSFTKDDSSENIYNKICVALTKFSREKALRKRYLNLEAFNNIGPYIEWRRLIDFDK